MPRPIVSTLIIFGLLLFGFILLALRGCENRTETPQEPIQYDNARENTTESTGFEGIQYSNDLPPTGGVRLW